MELSILGPAFRSFESSILDFPPSVFKSVLVVVAHHGSFSESFATLFEVVIFRPCDLQAQRAVTALAGAVRHRFGAMKQSRPGGPAHGHWAGLGDDCEPAACADIQPAEFANYSVMLCGAQPSCHGDIPYRATFENV